VAGQLLNSLKAATGSAAAVSHETKLGMMVITILFFAFCFLVYHKMDLHQRQLTQASIQPKGERSESLLPLDADAQMAAQSHASAATDPLTSIAELRSGSSFADRQRDNFDLSEEPDDVAQPAAVEFPANGSSFSEPAEEMTNLADNAETPDSEPADTELAFGVTSPANAFPPALEDEAFPESTSLRLDEPDFAATENAAEGSDITMESPAPASAGFEPELKLSEIPDARPVEFDETSEAFPAESEPAFTNNENEFGNGSAITAVPDVSDGPAFESGSVADVSTDYEEPTESMNEPGFDAEPAGEPAREPVLIAMLDPQESNGFSGGFLSADSDSSETTSRPAPTLDAPQAFPDLEPSEPVDEPVRKHEPRTAATGQRGTPFGNRGFDAVTQPGGRGSHSALRTAGGSGSDGKFSLAAFNYQNKSVAPAPDDGSTFDSIVVQNGDNYSKISKRVYGTVRYFSALAVFNQHRIAEPKHMRPGMIVLTPPKSVLEERYPQLFVDSQPKAPVRAEFLLMEDGSPAYRVGERETLSDISERFLGRSSRWVEILRLNQSNVKDPNKLKPGLILALPADATDVHVIP
jgi:hypothetical protein